jgi:hypothetical protein
MMQGIGDLQLFNDRVCIELTTLSAIKLTRVSS